MCVETFAMVLFKPWNISGTYDYILGCNKSAICLLLSCRILDAHSTAWGIFNCFGVFLPKTMVISTDYSSLKICVSEIAFRRISCKHLRSNIAYNQTSSSYKFQSLESPSMVLSSHTVDLREKQESPQHSVASACNFWQIPNCHSK